MTTVPSIKYGYTIITFSLLFLVIASYAIFFSAFCPIPNNQILLRSLVNDSHYKYFAVLLVPTTFYFVIANWMFVTLHAIISVVVESITIVLGMIELTDATRASFYDPLWN